MCRKGSLPLVNSSKWPNSQKDLQQMQVRLWCTCTFHALSITCMYTITSFRLKQFFKRPSLRHVQCNDHELFQSHSPTASEDESHPLLSNQIGGNCSINNTVPPLPSPLPTLEQLRQSSEPKNKPLGHPVKKRKTVASFDSQTKV